MSRIFNHIQREHYVLVLRIHRLRQTFLRLRQTFLLLRNRPSK
jgi:hypothetical protein